MHVPPCIEEIQPTTKIVKSIYTTNEIHAPPCIEEIQPKTKIEKVYIQQTNENDVPPCIEEAQLKTKIEKHIKIIKEKDEIRSG